MARLLYSAKAPNGKQKSGFVDAASAQEAVATLAATGLTEIQLHDEPAIAAQNEEREGLSEPDAAALAAFLVRVRENPGLATVLAEVARRNWGWLAIDCGIFASGWVINSLSMMAIGAALVALPFAITLWRYRHAGRYDRLLRSFATGDWARARELIAQLRRGPDVANVQFDLDVREAGIRAAQGELAEAVAELEKWRPVLRVKSPGLFEARLAPVYHAGGDYPRFVELMRAAYEQSSNDPSRRLDFALAEARFGDPGRAEQLLNDVDAGALPALGKPFIHWTRGMIALKRGQDSARSELEQAVAGFLERGSNPVVWTALALSAGAYALCLALAGQAEGARETLKQVWPVLKVHGDKPLLTMIRREIRLDDADG